MIEKLGLQRRYMFRKGNSGVEGDPKESWSGIEMERGVEWEKLELEISLVGINWEKRDLTLSRIARKTPVLRPALQSNQSSLCGLHRSEDQGIGAPNGQIASIKSAADGRNQISRRIIDEKRKKYRDKNGLKMNEFCDF